MIDETQSTQSGITDHNHNGVNSQKLSYNRLNDLPTLFDGDYDSLTNTPSLIPERYYGDRGDGDLNATGAVSINTFENIGSVSGAIITPYNTGCDVSGCTNFCSSGDKLLLIQTTGDGAGKWEIAEVSSVAYGTVTLTATPTNTYSTNENSTPSAQMVKIPEYDTVNFQSGSTLSTTAWDGLKGGICCFYAKRGVQIDKGVTLSMDDKGFLGGDSVTGTAADGVQGQGTASVKVIASNSRNGTGGAGGDGAPWFTTHTEGSPGGHLYTGINDGTADQEPGYGAVMALDLDGDNYNKEIPIIVFGGAGGQGGYNSGNNNTSTGKGGVGGNSGGIIIIISPVIYIGGTLSATGESGAAGSGSEKGGDGSGGSICLFSDSVYWETEPDVNGPTSSASGAMGVLYKGYPKGLPTS